MPTIDNTSATNAKDADQHRQRLRPLQRLLDQLVDGRRTRERDVRIQFAQHLTDGWQQALHVLPRAQDEIARWRLTHGRIDRALIGTVETGVFHFADHADDRGPRTSRAAAFAESLANGAVIRKEAPCPGAIDDDGFEILPLPVDLLEQPAFEQGQAEDAEVVGRRVHPWGHRLRLSGWRRLFFEIEVVVLADAIRRSAVAVGKTRHTRKRLDPPLELVVEALDARRIGVRRARQANRSGEDIAAVEAEVDVLECVETAKQQSGNDQERCRNGELAADQHSTQPLHTTTAC